MKDEENDRYVVVGITNAVNVICGTSFAPSIDLKVGPFLPWIKSVVGDDSIQ